jgi:hypothetical protein
MHQMQDVSAMVEHRTSNPVVRRFRNRIVGCPSCGEPNDRLEDHAEGDFVLFEDYERLRAAMWKYGKHLTSCAIQSCSTASCTCGWVGVRQTLAGEAAPPAETSELPKVTK